MTAPRIARLVDKTDKGADMTFDEKFEAWQDWMENPKDDVKVLGVRLRVSAVVLMVIILPLVWLGPAGRGARMYVALAVGIAVYAFLGVIAVWRGTK